MFPFNKPASGSFLLCFAKAIIITVVKNVVMNRFGRMAAVTRPNPLGHTRRVTGSLYLYLYSTCFAQTYCPSSEVLILYSQQLVFVILVMLPVC